MIFVDDGSVGQWLTLRNYCDEELHKKRSKMIASHEIAGGASSEQAYIGL